MLEVMPAEIVVYGFFGSLSKVGVNDEIAVGLASDGWQICYRCDFLCLHKVFPVFKPNQQGYFFGAIAARENFDFHAYSPA
jgi:hypothetical protein